MKLSSLPERIANRLVTVRYLCLDKIKISPKLSFGQNLKKKVSDFEGIRKSTNAYFRLSRCHQQSKCQSLLSAEETGIRKEYCSIFWK